MGYRIYYGGYLVNGGKDVTDVLANVMKANLNTVIDVSSFGVARSREEVNRAVESGECDVLICQDSIGSDNIGGGTLRSWQAACEGLKIVLVVPEARKGAKKMENLFMGGYYNALFSNAVTANALYTLITKGRSKEEAFAYYGLDAESIQALEEEAKAREERKAASMEADTKTEASLENVAEDHKEGVSSILEDSRPDAEQAGPSYKEEAPVDEKEEEVSPETVCEQSSPAESVEEAKEQTGDDFDLFGRPDEGESAKSGTDKDFEFCESDLKEYDELLDGDVFAAEAEKSPATKEEEKDEGITDIFGKEAPDQPAAVEEDKAVSEDGGFEIFESSDRRGEETASVEAKDPFPREEEKPSMAEDIAERPTIQEEEPVKTDGFFARDSEKASYKEAAVEREERKTTERAFEVVPTGRGRSSSSSQSGYVYEVQDEHLLTVCFDPIPEGLSECIDNVSCTIMVQTGEKGRVVGGKYRAGTIVIVAYPLAEVEEGVLLMEAPNKDLFSVEDMIVGHKCSVIVKAL